MFFYVHIILNAIYTYPRWHQRTFNGMRAVATIIMNRANVPYGEFSRVSQGGNVRNILTQEGQFVCMRTMVGGVYNPQNVLNMNPTDEQYAIVDWAIGERQIRPYRQFPFLF